jgi:hypothetical protein
MAACTFTLRTLCGHILASALTQLCLRLLAAAAAHTWRLSQSSVAFLYPIVMPASLVVFDRHVERNGGMTMRYSMQRCNCTMVGWGIYNRVWSHMKRLIASPHNEHAALCVEAHAVQSQMTGSCAWHGNSAWGSHSEPGPS